MTAAATQAVTRRWLLVRAGRGGIGFAVLGLAACSGEDEAHSETNQWARNETCVAGGPGRSGSAAGLAWWRVDFAYVSAYLIVRGREAALVDTGLMSTADQIGPVLEAAGTGWDGVRHILITHAHGDHFAALHDLTARAPRAKLYAGAYDRADISDSLPLRPLSGGEEVFGLQVVATPGHTLGHIGVFDADSAVLVAGDALTSTIHGLAGPVPEFALHMPTAEESVRKLAALEPRVILVGHGPPVEQDAAAQLRHLANSQ